ncbi:hypothetical protein AVEN_54962-1 [Araneus ventricosus]|uniref:Uncharacterized protein n=1 Tax=Araneus ventricosus TaxID=182803 RepID=A0A4Y2MAZ2_ARAVE|nr:hypothetical protein AVEN_54962-1 [Araneus ventricosus]
MLKEPKATPLKIITLTELLCQVSQKGILVAATLVDLKRETIPVRVLNLKNKPKIVDKGDVTATCESVVDIFALRQNFSEAHLPSILENLEILNEELKSRKERSGSTRFRVDYLKLNEILKKDSYPLPRIDDTLDALNGSQWFTTLDFKSGNRSNLKIENRQPSPPDKDFGSLRAFPSLPIWTEFLLWTDHDSLRWLLNFKEPESQIARWIQRLQEYDFEIQLRKEISHGNADALSPIPCKERCKHCANAEKISEWRHIFP